MSLFESFYGTNGDGRLTGFERVRHEEANTAYPGSQVPDRINDAYERSLYGSDWLDHVPGGEGSSSDLFADLIYTPDDDYDDDDDCYVAQTFSRDEPDDLTPEDQYWFAPKNSEDLFHAICLVKNLEGVRTRVERCYNCKHWDANGSATCTRSYACALYDRKRIDRDLEDIAPDLDGLVCDYFDFRHGDRG